MDRNYSPEQLCELFPGLTIGQLAMWRYRGNGGPTYLKLGKKIWYRESAVREWLDASERTGTAVAA